MQALQTRYVPLAAVAALLVSSVTLFGQVCFIQPFFPMDPGASSLSWQNVMYGAMFVISGVALILPGTRQ